MPDQGPASNHEIAEVLERVASLLEAQQANPFRVRAYRNASQTVAYAKVPVASLVHEPVAMMALPGIGQHICSAIREYVATGHLHMLERLEGKISPEDLFKTVPGIGEILARTIHDKLHIETLEDLELAAHDGRLEAVPGFSERRILGIRNSLQSILTNSTRARARRVDAVDAPIPMPPHKLLLEIDAEYRMRAAGNQLQKIAPRRFNPLGKPWLPIMHTEREGWHFTVIYSNSARAHRLGKTHDWVLIFYEIDGHEDHCTVVTEHVGPNKGQRVVRSWQSGALPDVAKDSAPVLVAGA